MQVFNNAVNQVLGKSMETIHTRIGYSPLQLKPAFGFHSLMHLEFLSDQHQQFSAWFGIAPSPHELPEILTGTVNEHFCFHNGVCIF